MNDYRSAPAELGQIASATLRGDGFFAWDDLRESRIGRALSRYGWGPDYLAGDVVFAVSNANERLARTTENRHWVDGAYFFAGRMAVGSAEGRAMFIPYSEIVGVEATNTGFFGSGGIRLHLPRGVVDPWLPTAQALAFFNALVALPPDRRAAAPRPIDVHPSAEDPIGAAAAERALVSRDPRMPTMLRFAHEWHRRGWLAPPMADAFVRRVLLLDRTLKLGRGMTDGMWLTSLGTADLVGALSAQLGVQPRAYSPGPPATFDFDYGAGGVKGVAGELATGIGVSLLTGGWLGTSKTLHSAHARFDGLRLVVDEQPGATRFQLVTPTNGQWAPIGSISEDALDEIVHAVTRVEAKVMLGRLLLGFERPFAGVEAAPREQLEQVLAQSVGKVDLAPFFPGFFDDGD